MISTVLQAHRLDLLREQLGLRRVDAKLSTTDSRSSRASCDRIDARPARYILRLTFCEKFSSGEFGKILPPPRHSGLEAIPARARPVPFCAHGFLCDLLMSLRPFCARVAAARIGLIGDDDLMHQRFVVFAAEQRRRTPRHVAAGLPLSLISLSSMVTLPSSPASSLPDARRCRRRRHPGPQPLTSSSWRSASTRTTSRFCVVRVHVAEVAGHALARKHAARILRHADRARRVVRTRVAVRCAVRVEVVALDDARETLALGRAGHVDQLADLERCRRRSTSPALKLGELVGVTVNSFSTSPASTPALARWPACGLGHARGAALAEGDLHGGIAVGVRRLDLGDAIVGHVQHRHRNGAPSSVKMRVMPTLRPTSPKLISFPLVQMPPTSIDRQPIMQLRRYSACYAIDLLQLDLHIHAGRQIELHQLHRPSCRSGR